MTNNTSEIAKCAKNDSRIMATTSNDKRNEALSLIADELWARRADIVAENEKDLAAAREAGLPEPIIKRLGFGEKKLADTIQGLRDLIGLRDPLGHVLLKRELDSDLILTRLTCPIGVIGVIFESRPDALVQIAALCLKSGNCAILKGGSEAVNSNRILFEIIRDTGVSAGLPRGFVSLLESRAETTELLSCDEYVDLIIPRGSNEFVRYIMDNSKIQVMGHSDGICHVYVDKSADIKKSVPVVADSKAQYVAVCNATETVLVHRDIAPEFLPELQKAFDEKNVHVHGTREVMDILIAAGASMKNVDERPADESDFRKEYLDYIVNIKLVSDIDEAVAHINEYGSHHTDAIMTEDEGAAERFMSGVDSAGVYHNCSTRFADGYRYGFGAEVGISTGKLHARGPVGLEGLVTYKYTLKGQGNIVADYAEGRRSFNFRDC